MLRLSSIKESQEQSLKVASLEHTIPAAQVPLDEQHERVHVSQEQFSLTEAHIGTMNEQTATDQVDLAREIEELRCDADDWSRSKTICMDDFEARLSEQTELDLTMYSNNEDISRALHATQASTKESLTELRAETSSWARIIEARLRAVENRRGSVGPWLSSINT
jgi:hypothetical protein